MWVMGADRVVAFGSAVVSLLLLGASGSAERDLVGSQDRAVAVQDEGVGRFDDFDAVGLLGWRRAHGSGCEGDRELQREDGGEDAEG